MHFSRAKIIIFSTFLLLSLSGCARLEWLDQKAGEIFFNDSSTENPIGNGQKAETAPLDYKNLTKEQKEKIEKWLNENNLNRYGDPMDTFYTGGTPLFNEMTGESKERFQYILEKTPDILEKINNF